MKNSSFKAEVILYWLLPLLGLGVPIIYYIFTYTPNLSEDMVNLFAYVLHLGSKGLHYSSDTWNSSISIVPLSLKYFLTVYAQGSSSWEDILYRSTICSYVLFCITYIFLVFSLKAQKIVTYIIAAVIGLGLGFYAILTSYACSNFMIFASVLFVTSGIIVLGIRMKTKLPIRICVSVLCLLPLLLFMFTADKALKQSAPDNTIGNEIVSVFKSPIGSDSTSSASESVQGLLSYMQFNSTSTVSASPYISNILSVCSEGSISVATAVDPSDLTNTTTNDCAIVSTENITSTASDFSYIVPNEKIADYSKYMFLAETVYSDDSYTVYNFAHYDFLSDATIYNDLKNLTYDTYDTAFISMYDVSNYNYEYFDTYMAWNCTPTNHIFSTLDYFNEYNELIWSNKINQYIMCIDPYLLYQEADYDDTKYNKLLSDNIVKIIKDNDNTTFYLYFPSYCHTHYEGYSSTDFNNLKSAYSKLTISLAQYENIQYYYNGYEEYIFTNEYIYETGSDCLMYEPTANFMLLENLSDSSRVTAQELISGVDELISGLKKYNQSPNPEYDFSDYCAIILGDSIFASFTDNTGLQAIMQNNSGIDYILQAHGGAPAASSDSSDIDLMSQLDITEINSKINELGATRKKLLFIIEFGLNDYFNNTDITNPTNKYDTATYSGAIRSTIETIKHEWSAADILVIAPGYVSMRQYGEEPYNIPGHKLSEYRNAALALAEEYNLYCINLCEVGITEDNCFDLIQDDRVHYNGRGRYIIAWKLMEYISRNIVS